MPKTYSYQKATDDYTTHELAQPDYEQMPEVAARITELCTIDGLTYVSVPDGMALPKQPARILATLKEVVLAPVLTDKIRQASPHVKLIEKRMTMNEDIRYSRQDEATLGLLLSFIDSPAVFTAYMAQCRAWDVEVVVAKDL